MARNSWDTAAVRLLERTASEVLDRVQDDAQREDPADSAAERERRECVGQVVMMDECGKLLQARRMLADDGEIMVIDAARAMAERLRAAALDAALAAQARKWLGDSSASARDGADLPAWIGDLFRRGEAYVPVGDGRGYRRVELVTPTAQQA